MHQLRTKIIFLMFITMILSAQLCLYAPEPYVAANIQMVDIVKVNSTKEKNTSNGGIRLTLKQLQKKFPNGKYWNHANNPGYENVYNAQDSYTSIPCKHKGTIGTDKQTCNGFQPEDLQLSWQCMGYAEKLGYDATGYNPRLDENGWYTDRRITALDRLKAGDIVRYCNNGHSIYVTGVDGENVTYTDCNTDGCCVIKWNQMTTKSVLKMSFSYVRVAPFEVKENGISITKAKVKLSKTSYVYNGKTKKPSVEVVLKGKKLKNGTDYIVAYKKTKNIGKGKVIITGLGDYEGTITRYIKITAKVGTIFSVKGYQYKITSVAKTTVTFCGVLSQTIPEIEIPETIKYGGVDFKVTAIGNAALRGNTLVTKVTIGNNVKSIGDYAFCNSRNLKEIKIKSTVLEKVGKNVFKGISANAQIKVPKSRFTKYRKLLRNKGQAPSVTFKWY